MPENLDGLVRETEIPGSGCPAPAFVDERLLVVTDMGEPAVVRSDGTEEAYLEMPDAEFVACPVGDHRSMCVCSTDGRAWLPRLRRSE